MSEFGQINLDEVAGEDKRLSSQGGQNNFLDQFVPMPEVKPGNSGSVAVRVLPPVKGGKLFQYNRTHKINNRSVHCPRPLINGKWDRNVACPICDYYTALWRQVDKLTKSGNLAAAEELKEEARGLKAIERYYYNAIVRAMVVEGEQKKNVGPRILSVGKILHSMIIKAIVGEEGDPDSKLGNITDIKNGYDFIIRKEVTAGEGFPKYDRSGFARNPSPSGDPEEIAEWVKNLHDLTKLRNPKDIEFMERQLAIHRGLVPDDDTSFDTDSFDAKWRQGGDDEMEYVTPVVTAAPAVSEVPARTSEPVVTEDVHIEDEQFLKELEEMGG